jgi:hypothetical protein
MNAQMVCEQEPRFVQNNLTHRGRCPGTKASDGPHAKRRTVSCRHGSYPPTASVEMGGSPRAGEMRHLPCVAKSSDGPRVQRGGPLASGRFPESRRITLRKFVDRWARHALTALAAKLLARRIGQLFTMSNSDRPKDRSRAFGDSLRTVEQKGNLVNPVCVPKTRGRSLAAPTVSGMRPRQRPSFLRLSRSQKCRVEVWR